MKVFLTGATGYTGAVVLDHLLDAGHRVTALARPQRVGGQPGRDGLRWVAGDFESTDLLADAAHAADAVIHIGAAHDVTVEEMERLDGLAIRAFADGLDGSGKVFINTSAAPVYGDTGAVPRDESEPILRPLPGREWRVRHDQETVEMVARGFRSAVIRPPNIYGRGGGVPAKQIERARETGKIRIIGEGARLMSGVHVDALARLYLLILGAEAAQGIYNAASDEVVRARDAAQVIAEHYGPGIEVERWSLEEARRSMGVMAEIAALNCVISADRARRELGWSPSGPSYIGELVVGSYRAQEVRA